MSQNQNIRYIDNAALQNSATAYMGVVVDAQKVLASWKDSLFSFEWLTPEGDIRSMEQLPPGEQDKRAGIEERIHQNQPIEKPVLGIGIMDNVEIGIGRAQFLTLIAHGATAIPVHIPKSNESDFKEFLSKVSS